MKLYSILIFAGFVGLGLSSCKKKTYDVNSPIITVVEPDAGGTTYLSTDPEVHVEFTVTDDRALHYLNVLLIENTNDTMFNLTPDVDNLAVYDFHEHALPSGITVPTPYRAIITAKDQYDHTTQRTINFFVAP